ncbi:uncharacterized protein LOC118198162 isoform X2 [Stegodyphus dumicola]|uniref:uncharacterized protein LOC118198162 isoform X2 n=1 Tax=Stegodyphus dumicola TaxID=202533 RepID=UPI0015AD5C52|nr:uncharacterized protein LOC118198162 isoform X2 [Stegodyphus dumicola]
MLGLGNKSNFTIDDAFEADDDDVLKTYGSTTESTPLKPIRNFRQDSSNCAVRIDDPSTDRSRFGKLKLTGDSFSKDSDSLIHGDSIHAEKFDSKAIWWKHPKVRENWKVMCAAFGLLIIGIGLLITGIIVLIMPEMGKVSSVTTTM